MKVKLSIIALSVFALAACSGKQETKPEPSTAVTAADVRAYAS